MKTNINNKKRICVYKPVMKIRWQTSLQDKFDKFIEFL